MSDDEIICTKRLPDIMIRGFLKYLKIITVYLLLLLFSFPDCQNYYHANSLTQFLYITLIVFWLHISHWKAQLEKAIGNTRCRTELQLKPGFTRVCLIPMSFRNQRTGCWTSTVIMWDYFLHHNPVVRKFYKKEKTNQQPNLKNLLFPSLESLW